MKLLVFMTQVLHPVIPFEVHEREGRFNQKEPQPVYTVNPSDRCALEEAMRIKGQFAEAEVTAVTVGPPRVEDCLYYALGGGADNAIHVEHEAFDGSDAHGIALALSRIAQNGYDLILCGNKITDFGGSQVGPIVAELLGLPQVTQVVGIEPAADMSRVRIQRKLERGAREVLECALPAVLGVESSVDQPRYVSIHSYLMARKKNIQKLSPESLNLDVSAVAAEASLCKVTQVTYPRPRPKKVFVPDSNLSAMDRLQQLMSGGSQTEQKKSSDFIEGTPEKIADEVLDYLKEQDLW